MLPRIRYRLVPLVIKTNPTIMATIIINIFVLNFIILNSTIPVETLARPKEARVMKIERPEKKDLFGTEKLSIVRTASSV
jgi:hypothetical protein